jgi:hypothetical protein
MREEEKKEIPTPPPEPINQNGFIRFQELKKSQKSQF